MLKRQMLWLLVGFGLLIGLAVAVADEKTSLEQVPAKVREAIAKLAGKAQITEVEQEKEDGTVFYEAEWVANGHKTEAKLTADGDLVETEEKVDAKDVPAKVKAVAAKEFPAEAKVKYEKLMVVTYEIEAKVDGKEKEIRVLPTGKITGKEEEKDDDNGDDDDKDK